MPTIAELKAGTLPVVVANHHGDVVEVNQLFELTFGWTATEIIGQSLTQIIPSYFHAVHEEGLARFTATGICHIVNHPLRLRAITKHRGEIESEHLIIAEKWHGQWVFAASLRPLE
jgi:PAS domain S-box-containing protein